MQAPGAGQAGTYQVQAPGGGHGALRLPAAQASVGVWGVLGETQELGVRASGSPLNTETPRLVTAPPPAPWAERRDAEGRMEGPPRRCPSGGAGAPLARATPLCPWPPPPTPQAPGGSAGREVPLGRGFHPEVLPSRWSLSPHRNCPLWPAASPAGPCPLPKVHVPSSCRALNPGSTRPPLSLAEPTATLGHAGNHENTSGSPGSAPQSDCRAGAWGCGGCRHLLSRWPTFQKHRLPGHHV